MKRILLLFIVLLAIASLGAVSAEDNATDVVGDEAGAETLTQDIAEVNISDDGADEVLSQDEDVPDEKAASSITSSNVNGYESFNSVLTFKLTSDNNPLANRAVSINVNGATYNRNTDANGVATLSVGLKVGSYTATCYYAGDNATSNATGTCTVTVKAPVKTKLKQGDKNIIYRQGSKCLFFVKLVDANGNAVKNQWVTFKVSGKTYKAKTNKYGNAKIFVNLKKGTRKVTYSFAKTAPYLASGGSAKIKVRAKHKPQKPGQKRNKTPFPSR